MGLFRSFGTRRAVAAGLALGLAGVMLAAPAANASVARSSGPLVQISIGTAGATAVYDPVFTGLETGLFTKNGFQVTWDNLTPTSAAAAILNGNIDLAMAGNSMVASILESPTAKVIFTNGPTVFYLVARPGFSSISALAGKTCAATTPGGAIDTAMRGAFHAAHVSVSMTYLQTNSAALAALENGNVQCAGVSPPTYEQAQAAGMTIVEPISKYAETSFIAANTQWATHHKGALVKFLRVYAKVILQTRNDRIAAEAGLKDYVGTTSPNQLNGSWNQYRRYWELEPYPTAQMKATFAGLVSASPPVSVAASAQVSQVVDNTYINACGKACIIPPLTKGPWQ